MDDSTGLKSETKLNTPRTRCESLVKQTAIRVAQIATQQKKAKKGELSSSPFCISRDSHLLQCLAKARPGMAARAFLSDGGFLCGVFWREDWRGAYGCGAKSIADASDRPRLK
jgi:hypothetical protein